LVGRGDNKFRIAVSENTVAFKWEKICFQNATSLQESKFFTGALDTVHSFKSVTKTRGCTKDCMSLDNATVSTSSALI
jgi:hypothetical protein